MFRKILTGVGATGVLSLLLAGMAPTAALAEPVEETAPVIVEQAEKVAPAIAEQADDAAPTISAAGTFQTQLGCSGDWQPECEYSQLKLDPESGLYFAEWTLAAGNYEMKFTADGGWDTNWGQWGVPGGNNIPFTTDGGTVYFVFNIETGRAVTSNKADVVTVPGTIQSAVGCTGDWMPDCLATAMFAQEDGTYIYETSLLPIGTYEFKVAKGMAWGQDWGVDGGSANISFTTTEVGELVTITWDPVSKVPNVTTANPQLPGTGTSQVIWLETGTAAWPKSLVENPENLHYILQEWPDVDITPVELTEAQKDLDWRTKTGYIGLALSEDGEPLSRATAQKILRGNVTFQADNGDAAVAATRAQIASVLDDIYGESARGADLGVTWNGGTPTLSLWAPTAQSVQLQLFLGGADTPEILDATWDDASGVWSVEGLPSWEDGEYLWDVEVYVAAADEVVSNIVTDPYSEGLTVNSARSVIVNMANPKWAPAGWGTGSVPALRNQSEQTIYELHVRDFSIWDETVPQELRGSYAAFTQDGTDGVNHLKALSEAGLTTVHLLPTFDIATTSIPELRSEQQIPQVDGIELLDSNLLALTATGDWASASEVQQSAVEAVKNVDGFNWGYDPFHWGTPEGSYATEGKQNGGDRNMQYREMVAALHDMDLRVVQDVVFNHTAAAGQSEMSILDRVVPGYYQRLNKVGGVENSTCCSNIATENVMAEKIMVDTLVAQAVNYHIDGFRFDLMGHHSLENMINVRNALDALTVAKDGVDGSAIYLYGEGWDFGEVAGNALFEQATQTNIAGSNIGAFNDRLRDAVRGGGPFDEDMRTYQGFGTGQFTDPNGTSTDSAATQEASLLHNMELIMVGLAGSLKDYEIPTQDGMTAGKDVDYNGQPAGYTASPQESVNYVEAHDNETLFDNGIFKLPADSSMDTRIRMQALANATVMLGQSPAFLASGTELLRSKSLDRDSYNSGDWFNAIDWSMEWNTFAKGLPIAEKNQDKWGIMRPLLENDANLPGSEDMAETNAMVLELLELRSSTPLFTLGDADLIDQKLSFPNMGANATPGVIVMALDDLKGKDVDPALDGVVVVFNATPDSWEQPIEGMSGRGFELSDVQQDGVDSTVKEATWNTKDGKATVPARTVAVFTQAASETPPTEEDKPSLTVDPQKVEAGSPLSVSGSDWKPGSTVNLSLVKDGATDAVVTGTVTVSEQGTFTTTLDIPAGATAGDYKVVAVGDGEQASAAVEVVAAGSGGGDGGNGGTGGGDSDGSGGSGGRLPTTGAQITGLVILGLLALGTGTALTVRSRRKA